MVASYNHARFKQIIISVRIKKVLEALRDNPDKFPELKGARTFNEVIERMLKILFATNIDLQLMVDGWPNPRSQ